MKRRRLNKIKVILFFLLFAFNLVKGQNGNKLFFYAALPLHIQPMAEVGLQFKHYWIFDTNSSNSGVGAGCEFNFGNDNSGMTIGPKIFYQAEVYMCEFGTKRKKASLYLVGRLSVIRYANSNGNDTRIAPEGGLSLFGLITLTYGYNFPLPAKAANKISGVFDNRLTLYIFINPGKSKRKRD